MRIFGWDINISNFKKKEKIQEEKLDNNEKVAKEPLVIKKIYMSNIKNLVVILDNDEVLTGTVDSNQAETVIPHVTTKGEVLLLFKSSTSLTHEEEINSKKDEEEVIKKELVNHLDIFDNIEGFQVIGDQVYFEGIKNIPIPSSIVAAFINLLQADYTPDFVSKVEEFESLKMFTYWLLLNPIESSRNDCLSFVKKNNIKITANGLLVCYRNIVKLKDDNHDLIQFISENYLRIKRNKKSPKNYTIYKPVYDEDIDENNEDDNCQNSCYEICENWRVNTPEFQKENYEVIGNLFELYNKIDTLQENKSYTDAYTNKKDIKIGAIYKEDEDKIDLDNTRDCSRGLHVGSQHFMFSGFGDTGVLALVNPMFVRSVPVSDAHKMRVSEMFICCTLDKRDYDEFQDIVDFSEEYCNQSLESLQQSLLERDLTIVSCQENTTELNIKEIINITDILKARVVTI